MSDEILAARVRGVNRAHAVANECFPKLRTLFAPYVGLKIIKADGNLLQKVKQSVLDLHLSDSFATQVWWCHYASYTLSFTVKTCENVNGIAYYHEVGIYLGDLDNCVLAKLTDDPPNYETDYTVEMIKQARERYVEASRAASEARSALGPFGEYDR